MEQQTSKCLTLAVSSSWTRRQIHALLQIRDLQDCSSSCCLPQTACAETPDGKGIGPLMIPTWTERLQLQQRNCGYAQQNVNFLWHDLACDSQVKLMLEIVSFSNSQGKKSTHGHPTGYCDGHFNLLWNSSSNTGYCSNTDVQKPLKSRMENVDVWVKMVHTALSTACSSRQVLINQSKEMPSHPFYTQTLNIHQRRHDCVTKVNSWLHVGF